jgi:predicted porin
MEKWKDGAGAVQASTAIAFSGRLNPGFSKKVDAFMLNGFVKMGGIEMFGTYEVAKGRTKTETVERTASQLAADLVYRFGTAENLYVGARYNIAKAELAGMANTVTVDRLAFAGGWFLTKNVLMKAEYVVQRYKDFPVADYRNGGKFNGYVIEAIVGF